MSSLKNNVEKEEKLISVITVNWNGEKWIKKYLLSLKKQTYKNIEIIIVDNNSSDNSLKIALTIFPEIKIIKNRENYGLAKATNIGVKKAIGKYILFINNDTWFEKDFISKLYDFYKKNEYAVVSAAEKRYFGTKNFICNTTIDPTGSPAYYTPMYSKKSKIFYLTVCFFCSKKDYIETKGVDEDFFMYYEDVDWFWRLTLFGKKFMIDTSIFIYHAGAGSSGSGIKYNFFLWRNQNTLQSLIKNYSIQMLILIIPLYFLQNFMEILFFLFLGKPKIAFSYIQGWIFNIMHLKRTIKKRNWIQRKRVVNDLEVLKKMYPFPSKALHLKNFIIR